MIAYTRLVGLGALLLAASLCGYAFYELVLYPRAGLPTSDFAVIVAAANTLRVGHWLKFGYALSLAMLAVGLYSRMDAQSPALARLASLAGASAVVLFLASGHLGLRILAVAQATFAGNPAEATATIMLRTVTIALLEAATFATGCYALLVNSAALLSGFLPRALAFLGIALGALYLVNIFLPDSLIVVAPLATIAWSLWLALIAWREAR